MQINNHSKCKRLRNSFFSFTLELLGFKGNKIGKEIKLTSYLFSY